MDLNLRGRRALITGSSKGIGLAIARSLAAEGVHVHLVARTQSELDKVTAEISKDYGVEAKGHSADLSSSAAIKPLAAAVGDVDILVNSAGAIPRGTLLDIDEERWRKAWDLKLFGAINLTREVYGPMCKRGKGVIINIAGLAGERPDAYYIAGSCANAAMIMFSRSLGGDSIRHGVRVLAVNPGPVETEMAKQVHDSAIRSDYFDAIPLKRYGSTEEIASAIGFLCSEAGGYINGQVLAVDGGFDAAGVGLPTLRRNSQSHG